MLTEYIIIIFWFFLFSGTHFFQGFFFPVILISYLNIRLGVFSLLNIKFSLQYSAKCMVGQLLCMLICEHFSCFLFCRTQELIQNNPNYSITMDVQYYC